MKTSPRLWRFHRLAAFWLALGLGGVGPVCLAQDFIDEEVAQPVVQNAFELHESNFEQWVYGNNARNGGTNDQLNSLLALSLSEVERSCQLTEVQKKKLLLAGHGDIKRFTDRVADARKVFERLRRDQNNIQEIFQETQPLAALLQKGLFGTDSFFHKTLGATLAPDQLARYRQAVQEKHAFRYQAKVKLAVTNLDIAVGFTAEQRQRLLDLVLAEGKPHKTMVAQYESSFIILKMSKIPEAKIRPLFDDGRWKALQQQFQQSQAWEQFFKSNGYLDEDETVEAAAPEKPGHD